MAFRRIAFFILLFEQFASPSFAQGTMYPEMGTGNPGGRKEAVDFMKEVQKQVRTAVKSVRGGAVRGVVNPHQYPSQLKVTSSSGSAQYDADCIEALLDKQRQDASPLVLYGFWLFPSELASDCPDKSATGKVLIFKIPPSVLMKYPGVFTPSEICSSKNYIELHKASSEGELSEAQITEISDHYQQWRSFLKEHPNATKTQIVRAMNAGNG